VDNLGRRAVDGVGSLRLLLRHRIRIKGRNQAQIRYESKISSVAKVLALFNFAATATLFSLSR
jgi:hypothetical protein